VSGMAGGGREARLSQELAVSFALLNLALAVDKADQAMLPAVYYELCAEFGLGPAALGSVTLCRGLAQAITALGSSALASHVGRVRGVGIGCLTWGIATVAVGLSPSASWLFAARTLSGAALGITIPLIWSIAADLFNPLDRGRAFGILFCSNNTGGMLGSLTAINFAKYSPLDVDGWRVAFLAAGAVSVLTAFLVLTFVVEPKSHSATPPLRLRAAVAEFTRVWRVKSFKVIILQGIPGTAPWEALSFAVLYFELAGFSHGAASLIRATFDAGTTVGTLIGGVLSDCAARWSPAHGRVAVAQLSVASGIPLWLVILLALPPLHAPLSVYLGLALLTGLSICWAGVVNKSVLVEVSPRGTSAAVYGLDRMLEGLVAPMCTAAVGLLAERTFGFESTSACGDAASADGAVVLDGGNGTRVAAAATQDAHAHALAAALVTLLTVGWTICFAGYCVLHLTYGPDMQAACAESGQSEMVQVRRPADTDTARAISDFLQSGSC